MSATEWMTETCSVYRNADGSSLVLEGTASCMPMMPVGQELLEQVDLNSLREPWQTFVADDDIEEGDVLELGTTRYHVRWAGLWPWPYGDEGSFKHVICEESKHV